MRADSITLLLAVGLAAFAGCQGGGGPGGSSNPQLTNGPYERPPSTYQSPPNSYETPPDDYEMPSGGGVCDSICRFYELAQCVADGDGAGEGGQGNGNGGGQVVSPAECRSSCAQAIGQLACQNELVALIDCLLHRANLTCDLLERAQGGDLSQMEVDQLQACESTVDAYSACEDPEGPKPMCNPPNSCGGCSDSCTRCVCENPQDTELCTRFCTN